MNSKATDKVPIERRHITSRLTLVQCTLRLPNDDPLQVLAFQYAPFFGATRAHAIQVSGR